ncbi:hypothetical protein RHSIM_Rhsim02G0170600 [Rhododendron simsii]|uniref:Uncharacterized protein n=1 Tax=Rhododendron simsii TaxID=118357 RepID=A0A834H947_RHOSS|nr:hypothetical protein RHSIM_Rhsim02G0170600 [Rhododendron simsii]
MASSSQTNLTIHQVEVIANTAGAKAMETLQEDICGLKSAVERLAEKVDAMTNTMSDVEHTIRMMLVANWDRLQGPPLVLPSPPREAKGG